MTDAVPPSIPPRKRPTQPAGGGRSTVSGDWQTGGAASASRPARADSPVVTEDPVRTETGAEGNGTPARRVDDVPAQASAPGSAASSAEGDELPSPLLAAVDSVSAWAKKAAGGTSAAIASLTRPRPKDSPMTTTSPAAGTSAPSAARPSATAGDSARPSTGHVPTVGPHGAPRRVRLSISRIDPWSVMKLSFLLSVAIGVMIVVAAAVVWFTLDGLQVFAKADDLVTQIVGTESDIDILQYVEFSKTISGATLVAVIDVFLITALSTIGAFLYNIVAALVGGVHVTMTDE
ncbi:DUF3566 domain-containing protein [Cellulomonas soli]|uniref:DUF3566 domain-containing protein n=1 Tax=Cellulomonas soli TaxID=931535 RepID=A0A512PI94_9CELL|nr:DUF3566 domain-containing protein [Cellulomonas soli]NYI58689.1 hypothetical protein [Cellulomonas soli]GEP70928.1 hypothetical protein CSO01_36430 [Cellulomonas soli]